MHRARLIRYKSVGPSGPLRKSLEDRFIDNVQIHGPLHDRLGSCRVWTGCVHASGFGVIRSGHRLIYVHRYAWERAYGPIPVGARVIQVCRNRLCVREDHLALRGRSIGPSGSAGSADSRGSRAADRSRSRHTDTSIPVALD